MWHTKKLTCQLASTHIMLLQMLLYQLVLFHYYYYWLYRNYMDYMEEFQNDIMLSLLFENRDASEN